MSAPPKKKTLPTKINIFGRDILVRREEMKEGEFGEYEQHKYLIKISKRSDINEARQTLFHEAIHAALHISGLSMVLPDNDGIDLEEAIVVCLENAFGHLIDVDKFKLDK